MTAISIEEIQRDLDGYLRKVEAGETLVITKAGKPVAQIQPISGGGTSLRPFGLCAGEFSVPDDFDEALPEELIRQFEGLSPQPPQKL